MSAVKRFPLPSPIKRKNIVLRNAAPVAPLKPMLRDDCTVLVVNSSDSMAREMTHQLTLSLPGCSIMYAPTLELARLILKRRQINLVVSSPILPDGSITRLADTLATCNPQPDLVVVGGMNESITRALQDSPYAVTALRSSDGTLQPAEPEEVPQVQNETRICDLGADLRNDLNNPLQEIVAMVFVAQSTQNTDMNPATRTALDAIDAAAKNMSQVVNDLEQKIRLAVGDYFSARNSND